jgi:histidine ammonia-lyase
MGMTSANKVRHVIANTTRVLAMECLSAAQAIDFRNQGRLGKMSQVLYHEIRKRVQKTDTDTMMYPMIHTLEDWVMGDELRTRLKKEESHV